MPVFVEAADPLGHLWIGVGIGGLLFLGGLVQGIHVGLLGGHLLLEGLHVERSKKTVSKVLQDHSCIQLH